MTRLTLIVWLLAAPAAAQDVDPREEARALFEQGSAAYQRGEWTACAVLFERSFTLVFAAELLFNIGVCYERAAMAEPELEYFDRAIAAFQRYARELPEAEDLEGVRARVLTLEAMRDRLPTEPEDRIERPPTAPPEVTGPTPPIVPSTTRGESGGPLDPVFAWEWTVAGAVATGALAIVSVVLGAVAQTEYSSLVERCMVETCSEADRAYIAQLATATNAMLVSTGAVAAGTGAAFGVEFDAQEGGGAVAVTVRGRF